MDNVLEKLDESLNKFIAALNSADVNAHFLGTKENSVLYAPGHGKGLYLGGTKLLSRTAKYALIEKLQQKFITTLPEKISELFTHVYEDQCMNSPQHDLDWLINSKIVTDPKSNYTELCAQSALSLKGKNTSLQTDFWQNFLDLMPNKAQLLKYHTKAKKVLQKTSPVLWADYLDQTEYLKDKTYSETNWHQKVKENHPSYLATKDKEKNLLNIGVYRYDENDPQIKSRKILLSDPVNAFDILTGKNIREDKQKLSDQTIPRLHARGEFLANQGKEFAAHADFYLGKAFYYQAACFAGDEIRNDVLFYILQNSTMISEKFIDLDITAIDKQTAFLKPDARSKIAANYLFS